MVEAVIGLFNPYSAVTRELQATLGLSRAPACRSEHGRLEILLRGVAMTTAPVEERVRLARRLAAGARPLLRAHSKRTHRRYADRAISVVFEDEEIIDGGIATTRFSYVESYDDEARRLSR